MALIPSGIERMYDTSKLEFGLPYVVEPVLQTEDLLRPVFDEDHHIFVVAVEGAPTARNIERAVTMLDLPARTWRDVRAIAFAGSELPRPEVCEALAKQSVTVVCDQKATRAIAKAEQYVADALARRQLRDAQVAQGQRAA